MWRQRLAPYCVAGTSAWCLCKPRHYATPSGALTSPGVWMFAPLEHAPLHVVPGTWPLISSLLYKHYLFSLPPGTLPFFLSVCSRSMQATSLGSKENERVTGIFRRYTSRPGPRLTHTRTSTVSNFVKFYLIYLFLTNTILNLYLSVAASGFCLEGTWFFKCYKIPQNMQNITE